VRWDEWGIQALGSGTEADHPAQSDALGIPVPGSGTADNHLPKSADSNPHHSQDLPVGWVHQVQSGGWENPVLATVQEAARQARSDAMVHHRDRSGALGTAVQELPSQDQLAAGKSDLRRLSAEWDATDKAADHRGLSDGLASRVRRSQDLLDGHRRMGRKVQSLAAFVYFCSFRLPFRGLKVC
jgi:hypothetical protein